MASIWTLSLPCVSTLLLLLSASCFLQLFVAGDANRNFHTIAVSSLLRPPPHNCSATEKYSVAGHNNGGTSILLDLLDGIDACTGAKEDDDTLRSTLRRDHARVAWLLSSPLQAASQNATDEFLLSPNSATIPAYVGGQEFVVRVGLGTPRRVFSLNFDTGSDLTWLQCKPCLGACYPQDDPLFDPVASSTFAIIPCTSPACAAVRTESHAGGCSRMGRCIYGVAYGDGSRSFGYYSQDSLTLTPNDVFSGFRFGCGQQNQGLFSHTAGILGLGRRSFSLVFQTANRFHGVFSYCLSMPNARGGFLSLGPVSSSSSASFTPLRTNSLRSSLYFVSLTGISVGGILIDGFSVPAGTIVDSGTTITRLPAATYASLRASFRRLMSQYRLASPFGILDTCYDFSGMSRVTFPKVSLHFAGGAELPLNVVNTFLFPSAGQFCLAFATTTDPGSGLAIVGNRQQRGVEVVYDVPNGRVGFRPGACSMT